MAKNTLETKKLKQADGTIAYYAMNKLHSVEGPALIPQGNEKLAEYYLFGIKHTKDQWLDKVKKSSNGQPFHKTAAGRNGGRV